MSSVLKKLGFYRSVVCQSLAGPPPGTWSACQFFSTASERRPSSGRRNSCTQRHSSPTTVPLSQILKYIHVSLENNILTWWTVWASHPWFWWMRAGPYAPKNAKQKGFLIPTLKTNSSIYSMSTLCHKQVLSYNPVFNYPFFTWQIWPEKLQQPVFF
jgi:hypothetical protein